MSEENRFSLLSDDKKELKTVEKKIVAILKKATKDLKALDKKYPDAGIGDTVTDECIADFFYDNFHWGTIDD